MLASEQLEGVRGGFVPGLSDGPFQGGQPKSNGWTGAIPDDAYCAVYN
jgi:hypothetical protein